MRGRLRRAVGAVAAAVAVVAGVLLLAEAALRLRGEPLPRWPAEPSAAMPGIRVDPVLGPALEPGWSGRWYAWFDVAADAHGFRSTGVAAPPAPRHRIGFVGDSCTFGWGIDTPDTFVARLDGRQRAAGADMELLDAAYPGESAVVGRWVLEARVLPLRPDVVVAAFSVNNAFRLSLVSDAERFRLVRARRVLFRSHLVRRAVAWLARRAPPPADPRDRAAVGSRPLASLRRVASAAEFDAGIRAIVRVAAGPCGGRPRRPPARRRARPEPRVRRRGRGACASARGGTRDGARAAGDPRGARSARGVVPGPSRARRSARRAACAAVRVAPRVSRRGRRGAPPPAGRARVRRRPAGEGGAPLRGRARALRPRGRALDVPIVDVTLHFQARGGEKLMYDPAHPNALGHGVIADALWPVLAKLTGS